LAYGRGEGREAFAAIGRSADIGQARGFDAEYYLLSNRDVAKAALAAGGDSFTFAIQHYDRHGWKEGRDPNSVFDTSGYLLAYRDVAAAGINPLRHYDQYGWKEGRDPSADFDTEIYLATHADIRVADVNPMQHYLQFGALEGRGTYSDGHFG
jgi:hypothetical protein